MIWLINWVDPLPSLKWLVVKVSSAVLSGKADPNISLECQVVLQIQWVLKVSTWKRYEFFPSSFLLLLFIVVVVIVVVACCWCHRCWCCHCCCWCRCCVWILGHCWTAKSVLFARAIDFSGHFVRSPRPTSSSLSSNFSCLASDAPGHRRNQCSRLCISPLSQLVHVGSLVVGDNLRV